MAELDDTRRNALLAEVRKAAEEEMEPYLQHIREGFQRVFKLGAAARKHVEPHRPDAEQRRETSDDIFRAIVVLTHAYLEDFLRTLAKAFLPMADERTINDVPLVGLGSTGRAEKFLLGKLIQHKGKLIEDVIRESVDAYLERSSFNSATEIVSFLERLGLNNEREDEKLSVVDKMIRRRHLIVHRADKAGTQLQAIDPTEVLHWVDVTYQFMESLVVHILMKKYTPEVLAGLFKLKVEPSQPAETN
jgi:HEPN superfamily RiboL-PSP-like protein